MRKLFLSLIVISAVIFNSCKKTDEVLDIASVNDYYPLQPGKYITYNLDSTIFINFGTAQTVVKYQVKHQIDALITDNLGRPAYRIIRFIRSSPAAAWVPDNTFMAVKTDFTVEFIENNLRFIKLKSPVRNGYTWKGNSYIDPYASGLDLKYLEDWDYTYDSVNVKQKLGSFTLDSTLKVAQRNEILGNPSDPNSYHEINFGEEKYAKGLGLVYRNFLHIEYQPPTPGRAGYRTGYGVKMTMIDHN